MNYSGHPEQKIERLREALETVMRELGPWSQRDIEQNPGGANMAVYRAYAAAAEATKVPQPSNTNVADWHNHPMLEGRINAVEQELHARVDAIRARLEKLEAGAETAGSIRARLEALEERAKNHRHMIGADTSQPVPKA